MLMNVFCVHSYYKVENLQTQLLACCSLPAMYLADLAVLVLETIANNMVVLAEHEIVLMLTAVLRVTQNGNHEVRVAVVLVPGVISETCCLVC